MEKPSDFENKSENMRALEEAQELLDRLQNSNSNNPNAHRSRINALVLQISELEKGMKLSGELPATDLEKTNFALDELYPNAKSKAVVEYEGAKYKLRYFPLQSSRSGKTVQEWGHRWEPME